MNLNLKLVNHMFANMKVGYISKHKYSTVKFNTGLIKILRFLKNKGYIISFYRKKESNKIVIYLKYNNFTPYIFNINVLLKKNKLSYLSLRRMLQISNKNKNYVLSTKKGLLFLEEAINYKIGGSILLEIKI